MARLEFQSIDEVLRAGFAQTDAFFPEGTPAENKQKLKDVRGYDDFVDILKTENKLDDDAAHTIASATTFGFLEKFGINPEEWMLTVPLSERKKARYGTDELNDAIKFYGSWTAVGQAALSMATIAALVTAITGASLAAAAQITLAAAIRKGTTIAALNILKEQLKLRAIKWLSVPAFLTAAGTLWSYFANTQLAATGDTLGYLKQNVAKNEAELAKLEAAKAGGISGDFLKAAQTPKTRITMTKQSKPSLFIGTLFSQRVKTDAVFERKLDDQVTSQEDLRDDAQQNLNKWLASLPSRLFYTINVALNPFDENGIKQTGYWATLSIFGRRISGQTVPLDTILLGPVDPITYFPKPTETMAIQQELPELLSAKEIAEIQFPTGEFQVVDKTGSITPVTFREVTDLAPKATLPVVAPATPTAQAVTPTPFVAPSLPSGTATAPSPVVAPVAPPFAEPSLGFVIPGATPPSVPLIHRIGARIISFGLTGNSTLRVRQKPSITGAILYGQPNDTTGTISAGPFRADGEVWWHIVWERNDKGIITSGWSAERYLKLL